VILMQKSQAAILVDLVHDRTITEFLDAQKKRTRHTYTTYMRRLIEFSGQNGSEILKDHKNWERRIFAFHNWLIEKGYSENYCQSCTGCLRGFFAYYRKPLFLTGQERKKLSQRNRTTSDYYLEKEDILRMAQVSGSLRNLFILYVGKSIGLRAEDFIMKLTYGLFRSAKLDSEAPVCLGELPTGKEHVKAFPFLDSDALGVVREILKRNTDKKDSDFVLMSKSKKTDKLQPLRPEHLSYILRTMAYKAGIQNGNRRIRFHCLRKYLCDRLSMHMAESRWKMIVGKKVVESAYIAPNLLREDYKRAMPDISISANGNGKVREELETLRTILVSMIGKEKLERMLTQKRFVQGPSENLLKDMPTAHRPRLTAKQLLELYAETLKEE
jgi:integrase